MDNILYTQEAIGQSDTAIYRTVMRMAELIKTYAVHPYVRWWAEQIVGEVEAYQTRYEIGAVYNFIQENVRYTKDAVNWEWIKTPELVLHEIQTKGASFGDCDDMTVLGLTLLRSIGFPVAIKIVSYHPDREFTHVYGLVFVDGKWEAFDAIKKEFYVGYEHPGVTRYGIFDIDNIPSLAYFL